MDGGGEGGEVGRDGESIYRVDDGVGKGCVYMGERLVRLGV